MQDFVHQPYFIFHWLERNSGGEGSRCSSISSVGVTCDFWYSAFRIWEFPKIGDPKIAPLNSRILIKRTLK